MNLLLRFQYNELATGTDENNSSKVPQLTTSWLLCPANFQQLDANCASFFGSLTNARRLSAFRARFAPPSPRPFKARHPGPLSLSPVRSPRTLLHHPHFSRL